MINVPQILSQRSQRMQMNVLREILKVVSQPGMISLAAGNPAPQSFPLELLTELSATVLAKYGPSSLQYDATEGFQPLREALLPYLTWQKGVQTTVDNILVFHGSQSVLDAVGKMLLTPGDKVALAAPTYVGALSAFNAYEPAYVSIATDDDGVVPAALDAVLARERVKFVYLIPTFQNPTGRTIPLARRRQIAEIVQAHQVLLVEDDPYSALRYSGDSLPPIQQFAPENVLYISTFSKILAPGLRIGFCATPAALKPYLVMAKQAADLHTSSFGQAIATEYLQGEHLEDQLPQILAIYQPRRDAMLQALAENMPAGFSWNRPDGGMFLWLEGPEGFDAEQLQQACLARGVAFVPGKYYYPEPDQGLASMRLNFTMADEATIAKAIQIIGQVAHQLMGAPA